MSDDFGNTKDDIKAIILRSAAGAIPFAGQFLCEIITEVIPGQKNKRMSEFIGILSNKISNLENGAIEQQCKNEELTDLIEEALRQASRATSTERKEYIACLLSSALSKKDIEYNESKHLMRILGELNDVEIIWLRYYVYTYNNEDKEFREKHREVITPVLATLTSSPEVFNKQALQESYKLHLANLGLLEEKYEMDEYWAKLDNVSGKVVEVRKPMPKYDHSGKVSIRYEITQLGRLLIKEIGM